MLIRFDRSGIQQTQWYEYVSRFFIGGVITVLTGIIAHRFGPVIGGLFLAFPAIFPASASLIEKHQREKNERMGVPGRKRGRKAASVDAAGAAMGSIGLMVFALIAWKFLPQTSPWLVLAISTMAWATTAIIVWFLRKRGLPLIHRLWS